MSFGLAAACLGVGCRVLWILGFVDFRTCGFFAVWKFCWVDFCLVDFLFGGFCCVEIWACGFFDRWIFLFGGNFDLWIF